MKIYPIIFEIKTSGDIDMNVTQETKKFAEIMDKVSVKFNIKEPIITSGLRLSDRQVTAMFDVWKKNGTEYLINLYSVRCKSCSKQAGAIAKALSDKWATGTKMIPQALISKLPSALPPASILIKQGIDILSKFPEGISAHQQGKALDYGLISNKRDSLEKILNFIKTNNLADFELIDESKADNEGVQQAGSHYHITVHAITQQGIEFLKS